MRVGRTHKVRYVDAEMEHDGSKREGDEAACHASSLVPTGVYRKHRHLVTQALGCGTMVYPTLLAAITDHAHPTWRASSLGVYRFWRDLGYAVGALLSGVVADLVGLAAAIHLVAALTLVSGLVVVRAMGRTSPRPIPARA